MEWRAQQPGDAQQPGKDGGDDSPPLQPFLEVTCRSSGKVWRFAVGTTARYALHAINRKLEPRAPPALHVEAVRDGKEPVSFSPSAALADYGRGWSLQTVTAQDATGIHHAPHAERTVPFSPPRRLTVSYVKEVGHTQSINGFGNPLASLSTRSSSGCSLMTD
ncbi:uncharacterized protein [Miscanthus floridulus]|uniref:uncharacterized protein n=1 Tax=Miscanthus floridulus TaxID=154761 RepID=UPI00345A7152